MDNKRLPKEVRDKVYRPAADEKYDVEIDLTEPDGFEGELIESDH